MSKTHHQEWRALSQTHVALKNGILKIGVFEVGDDGVVVAQTMSRKAGGTGLTTFCGKCSGVSVGCIQCKASDGVTLDCVKKELRCGIDPPGSTGITGDFDLGADAGEMSPPSGEAGA